MNVYGDYDQAGLDAQYNLRARHPDFQAHFDAWAAESERVAAALPSQPDVPYGDSPGQRLDAFPAPAPGAPVHVFIHGGYWQGLDKSFFRYLAEPLVGAGAALVVVNYDLAPQVGMDEIVAQVRRAVAWAWRHAGGLNADPARLYVSGHSAGGHLTAMMLATDWPAVGEDLPADVVRAGCAISGLFDLEPIRLCYLNDVLSMDEDTARRNSPLLHLPERGAPLICAVGGAETDEFLRQNAGFAAAWRMRGFPGEELVLPGENHFTIMREAIRPDFALTAALLRQMGL